MPHVVTQACCGDASCVFACPVNCIHPTPDEPDFLTAEMLYIDAESCVDCGSCVSACPVGAIVPDSKLTVDQLPFVDINTVFSREPGTFPVQAPVPKTVKIRPGGDLLRVAIVGSGPAALYAADELLKQRGVEVNVFDKLPTPYGLVRAGVAPDHQTTKDVVKLFGQIEDQAGFGYFLNVEVGRDVTHRQLLDHHHAVLYATGASKDRRLGIPGEDLPGSETATDFVAWYNGHPDHADYPFDLSRKQVVIVGNGNVALDVARILTSDPAKLATTDIADHALAALRDSQVEEVVLMARRGVAQAAFTLPELMGLLSLDDIDFVVDPDDLVLDAATETARADGSLDLTVRRKIEAMQALAWAGPGDGSRKRIVFRFLRSPAELMGQSQVNGLRVIRNELKTDGQGIVRAVATTDVETLECGLVLRSIGYRGIPVDAVPFDDVAGVIPNAAGRVAGAAHTYVAGWIKRGPTGYIGTNKTCAHETVSALLNDFNAGLLPSPRAPKAHLADFVVGSQPRAIDLRGWRAIDAIERRRGLEQGRVRQKFTRTSDMVAVADREPAPRRRFPRPSR